MLYGIRGAKFSKILRNFQKTARDCHDAVIRVYDAAGNVIETHEHKGDFKDW
jgi:hypothetical protein